MDIWCENMHITRESVKSAQIRENTSQERRTRPGLAEKPINEANGLRDALKKAGRIGTSALFAGAIAVSSPSTAAAKEVRSHTSIQKNTCTESSMVIEPFLQFPRDKPFTVVVYAGSGDSLEQFAGVFNGSNYFMYINQNPPAPYNGSDKNIIVILPDIGNVSLYYVGLFNTAFNRERISSYAKSGIAGMLSDSPKEGLLRQWPSKQPYHTLEECKTSFESFPYIQFYFAALLHVRNPNPLNYITFSLKAMPLTK